MTVFQPVAAATVLRHQLAVLAPPLLHVARWLVPLMLILWSIASGFGRTLTLRRLDPTLHNRPAPVFVLGLLRTSALLLLLAVWGWGAVAAGRVTVTGPASAGAEPNLVLYAALVVGMTLLLFLFWAVSVWALDLAILFAMATPLSFGGSVRAALHSGLLRSKLMETNLVMGIVKVALLVLALVFSACPLPFQSVSTQSFLENWWIGTAIWYLVISDLFHVIRRAAYLTLFRALATESVVPFEPVS